MFVGGRDSLGGSTDRSGSFLSQDHNDDEEYLIAGHTSFRQHNSYVQMNRSGNVSKKFMLKATLVTVPDRSVIVEVSETDTIGNL